ncbi:PadR family transcriptional regulator [Microtetraspora sp. AC03309]|uniref:PadR family transcriptional regulator n=1 Tax=Microtetraspora sp. AC03309 TaxID=2779376 RepID=UPI001E5D0F5A|nr:PadR family transcriptional regulator [Microtetraspora sp. AC03309]MCC5577437.1 PadR family transcriptional regulator [Microtetraspora sp. AC03309]
MARSADNPLAVALMGLLMERPMHPYEMAAVLRERGKDASVRINRGSLYDVVAALEGQGWITPSARVREGNRPARTVYALTGEGRAAFVARLDEQIRNPRREYPVFLTAVAYLGALGQEGAAEALRERAGRLRAAIADDERTLREVLASGGVPRLHVIEAEYALHMARAELGWVNAIADEVSSGTLPWPAGGEPTGEAAPSRHDERNRS